MNAFEKTIEVQQEDIDYLQHVNNVRYVKWVQDIAKSHWNSLTTSEQQLQLVWVVLSHNIHYKAAAVLGDILLLKTYVIATSGVTCTRIVEMINTKNNKLIVHSETKWCLLKRKNKKPARITKEIQTLFH